MATATDTGRPATQAQAASINPPAPEVAQPRWLAWLLATLLVLLTIAFYWPALHNDFIWDDDAHLTNNPHLRGWAGLVSLWTTSAARICPLVQTSFWVQRALWGLVPWPYHLVNILMHAASGVALWQALRALKVRGAWLGAALWVLHPVGVESVAWITELKNTQSAFFYLLSIWFFVQWCQAVVQRPPEESWAAEKFYWLALLCGVLAMTSKSSTVILPLALGLCAWWVEGRWGWRMAARLGPFFVCSALAGALSVWTQRLEGTLGPEYARSGPERLVTAGKVVWFYLGKLIWPHPLVFVYPRWEIDASHAGSYLPLAAVGVTTVVLWLKRQGWGRPGLFAWVYFLIALLPVLGLVNHVFLRYSFVGDHFQYLASMGPLALAAAGLSAGLDSVAKGNRFVKPVVWTMLAVVLGGLTWERTYAYRDNVTLWRDTVARNPASWMAHDNLGYALGSNGQTEEAIHEFQQAIRLKPGQADFHNNLGIAFYRKGQMDEAIGQYLAALRLNPDYTEAHYNLGIALGLKGQTDGAIHEFQETIRRNPDHAEAHFNLGVAFGLTGQTDQTIREFQEVIRRNPDYAGAHYNLGVAYFKKGRMDEAIRQYQETLRLKPDNAEAHYNLGLALGMKGQTDQTIRHLEEALRLKPDFAAARESLAAVLATRATPPKQPDGSKEP
jgi:tetratricopeptide (TPR) repeat protein